MDISPMGPYTNVVCPGCGSHTRVKCELGQYLLLGRHAAGGMSMVFKASDVTLDREVAIKILNEDYSQDEKRMQQFEHEAKITAAISHPHVVRVFTVGKAYGHFYIAMEMVSGENLEQRISRENAIGEDVMLPLAAEIIAGLQAAKHAGLIHRDVKPGNILFDAQGHVKIVDFGLALVTQGGKARATEIWATPYYVPPEALVGGEEDFRSDIYALGATLYHALSGYPPFPDTIKSTRAVAKAKEDIPPLAEVAPWLKPETCYLVDKAMALRPEDRFSSYAVMGEALRAAFKATEGAGASEPIRSRERAHRRAQSKHVRLGLLIIAVLTLVLLGSIIGLLFINQQGDDIVAHAYSGKGGEGDQAAIVLSGGADYDPEVAVMIAKQFRRAHEMIKEKQYSEAREVLTRLMHDDHVKEPTSSWAGVEAVIAAWLGGNSGDASEAISSLRQHMASHEVPAEGILGRLGEQLQAPKVIRDVGGEKNTMAAVYLMAVALKNWEMGAWDAAVPLFEKIQKNHLAHNSPWRVYPDLAQRYLSDFKKMESIAEMADPVDLVEAKQRLVDYKKLLRTLETQGRSRFRVRVWQLRLHRRMKGFQVPQDKVDEKVDEALDYEVALRKFRELVAVSKYAEAAAAMKSVEVSGGQKEGRHMWVYLAETASALIEGLEKVVIPREGLAMPIRAMDGQVYQRVVRAQKGGIHVKNPREDQRFLPWSAIQPDSVFVLFQKAYQLRLSNQEGQRRIEQAVCYLWLIGKEDRAERAASKLAEVNLDFRLRWQNIMKAQHKSP
ncbi:MAG: serine/threonine protein kinase [Verrucomicrobiae bacterium]|nr:serine/threonine protein kinase [Verrucomicrobiae bacterium]